MPLRPALLAGSLMLAACGSSAPADAQATAQSDEAFEEQLRRVLMENPGIILEAVEAYRAKMEEEAAAASREAVAGVLPELVNARAGNAVGASAEDAELVIIEFFDYHCGFCRQAVDDVMARVAENENLRVVFQEYPILREESEDAAIAALAAASLSPEAYKAVHAAFMNTEGVLDEKTIDRALDRAGVDARAVERASDDDEVTDRLNRSIALGQTVGVGGTPFFIIYNPTTDEFEIMEGYRADALQSVIEAVRG